MITNVGPECEAELIEAARWYQLQAGNGGDLIDAFQQGLDSIALEPRRYPRPHYYIGRREYRRLQLERFPYAIVFELFADHIDVVAFAHTSREPGYWLTRS